MRKAPIIIDSDTICPNCQKDMPRVPTTMVTMELPKAAKEELQAILDEFVTDVKNIRLKYELTKLRIITFA